MPNVESDLGEENYEYSADERGNITFSDNDTSSDIDICDLEVEENNSSAELFEDSEVSADVDDCYNKVICKKLTRGKKLK